MQAEKIRTTIGQMLKFSWLSDRTHCISVEGIGRFHINEYKKNILKATVSLETSDGEIMSISEGSVEDRIEKVIRKLCGHTEAINSQVVGQENVANVSWA